MLQKVKQLLNGAPYAKYATDMYKGQEYTPDYSALQQYHWHLVFVYDESMLRNVKHDIIRNIGVYSGWNGFTRSKFSLWKKNLGLASPAIALREEVRRTGVYQVSNGTKITMRHGEHVIPQFPIKGELFIMRAEGIKELDNYKTNGVAFHRERARILVPYTLETWVKDRDMTKKLFNTFQPHAVSGTAVVPCWMYVGDQMWWEDLIEDDYCSLVKSYHPAKVGPYYYFSPIETAPEKIAVPYHNRGAKPEEKR